MSTRRLEKCRTSRSGIPTTSRTGRFPGSAPARRGAKRTPTRRATASSSRVLYRSDAATPTAYRARPSNDSHRGAPSGPSRRARILFATATWVCRSGSPARESWWSNAAQISPYVSTCATPPFPRRVNPAWASIQARVSATTS